MTELNFKGKEFVYNHHLAVPFRPLVPHPEKGIGEAKLDGNLIIHGDNLHALKALLPMYAGKVDCIFIDPPYNTGNEGWSYNDNVNSPMIREWLAANPIGIEDGLRHDKWCAMMWPRLRLLHELLHEDGLLFISINDIEEALLWTMLGEIFGEDRMLGKFVWKSRQNKDNRNISGLSNDHEYVFIVGRQLQGSIRQIADLDEGNNTEEPWASGNMVGLASKESRPNLHFELINPKTGINYGCPSRGWRYEKSTMDDLIRRNLIIWPPKPTGRPRERVLLNELPTHTNVSSVFGFPLFTSDGTAAYERIFGNRNFPFPKPPDLIKFLIKQHPDPNAVILDSFAGSGTTAEAVLLANAEDGGRRRMLLVELESHADDVTAERLRRVINGYEYEGTQSEELHREKITFTSLRKADKILEGVHALENLHGHRFDKIAKKIDDGVLTVTGEKKIAERVEGLGGSFTYCTLGAPVELDAVLSGKELPSFAALGAALFHMATNRAFDAAKMAEGAFYLGETETHHVWLIYRPDLDWLKSPEAALTLSRAKGFATARPGKKHLVFAPSRFVSQRMLSEQNIPVDFVPLPFALYRIDRS